MGSSTAYNTSLIQTAADVCLKINRNPKNKWVTATNSGTAVITLTAVPGLGALLNSAALTITSTTLTSAVTSTTFGSGTGGGTAGVDAVNGLKMDYNAAAGLITKDVTQTWSGTAVAVGTQTAGWFRVKGSVSDAGALDSGAVPSHGWCRGHVWGSDEYEFHQHHVRRRADPERVQLHRSAA
ncbi:MAG: hypothetical protein IPM06_21455 [Rhizobiales bacterium]|nr:hypothetical protein [Hyphomicrobiales bacterium]